MEILVCIKQVPGTADVEVDSVTGVLKRDGVSGTFFVFFVVCSTNQTHPGCLLIREN